AINRANYVIENVTKMMETASATSIPNLESIIAEARLLRGMVYFRLISMWGDVPYFENVIKDITEEVDFSNLPRVAIGEVKNHIMDDFNYAFDKLPAKRSAMGRGSKPAA